MKYAPSIKTFHKGLIIFKEGQPSNVAYLIKSGRVEISKNIEGKRVVLASLGKGEIFGEMAVITRGVRTANAEAAEYSELMVLNEQLLASLLKQSPSTVRLLTNLLIQRLKESVGRIQDQDTPNPFFSFCKLLHLHHALHAKMDRDEQRKTPNWENGLNWKRFLKEIKTIVLISQLDAKTFLDKLATLNLVQVKREPTSRQAAFTDTFVRIVSPDSFMETAKSLGEEMAGTATASLEFEDIMDFAARIKAEPGMLYKKMANMEVPEELFFLHREKAEQWAAAKGNAFFQKLARKTKKPEDLADVDDMVYVDNPTLKNVFGQLGYHKLAVLHAMGGDATREKIERNLAKKMAAIVKEQAAGLGDSPPEGPEAEEEFLALVRQAKGVEG